MHLRSYHSKKLGRGIAYLLGNRNYCPSLLYRLVFRLVLFEPSSQSLCHCNNKNSSTIQKLFLEPVHCRSLGLEWRYSGQWKSRAWATRAGYGFRMKMLLSLSPQPSLTCISLAGLEKRPDWGGIVLCWPCVHGPISLYYERGTILLSPVMMDILSSAKFLICQVSLWEKMVLFALAHSSKPKITKSTMEHFVAVLK